MMPKILLDFKLMGTALLCFLTCASSQKTFDFIVVGAGAGGSVVSRRLVENGFNVLLIESGGFPREGYDVPARAPEFVQDRDMSLHFQSIPQKKAALLNNGKVSIVAGKTFGGSTSINAMWFNRGNPRDWDNWANVTGDVSWRYQNMLKYFKRSEHYKGDFPSDQHDYGGPITVSRPRYSPGLEFWLRAGRELGFPVRDSNGPQEESSFAPVEFSKRHGRRVSAFEGYLAPILGLQNLHILANTNVTNVIIKDNRAVGVCFLSNGVTSSVKGSGMAYATKEVIISAGTYFSPLILQRSGIGPREVLEAAKIPVIKELPVGKHFQDHPAVTLHFAINNASVVLDEGRDLTPENWRLFNAFGDGPYSSTRGATGQAFISSSAAIAEGNGDWPDLQFCMTHSTIPYFSADGLYRIANLTEEEVAISTAVFLGRPTSRGSVRINTKNILGDPIVDVGFFNDPRDLQVMLEGVKQAVRVYERTNAYRSLRPRYTPVKLPACEEYPVKSNEYWICFIKQTTSSGSHPVGTNRMGDATDPTAVVDTELRVIGIDGLRVIDASLMPVIPNANLQAPVYAIAEKASDLVLKKWQR